MWSPLRCAPPPSRNLPNPAQGLPSQREMHTRSILNSINEGQSDAFRLGACPTAFSAQHSFSRSASTLTAKMQASARPHASLAEIFVSVKRDAKVNMICSIEWSASSPGNVLFARGQRPGEQIKSCSVVYLSRNLVPSDKTGLTNLLPREHCSSCSASSLSSFLNLFSVVYCTSASGAASLQACLPEFLILSNSRRDPTGAVCFVLFWRRFAPARCASFTSL